MIALTVKREPPAFDASYQRYAGHIAAVIE
jgi:hypothetical protein